MSDTFNPYREWLGLESGERPNHYALLGLPEFESDAGQIAAAADGRMQLVRQYQTGPRGKFTQQLLNELSAAKLCLLDPRTKKTYDAVLQGQRAAVQAAVGMTSLAPPALAQEPPPAPPPLAVPTAPPAPNPPAWSAWPAELADEEPPGTAWRWPLGMVLALILVGTLLAGGYYLSRDKSPPVSQRPEPSEPSIPDSPGERPRDRKRDPLPEETIVISQEGNGDLSFPVSIAEFTGDLAAVDRDGETLLIGWHDEASARWRFKVVQPAIFQVQIVYAAESAEGSAWELELEHESRTRDISAASSVDEFVTDEFFWKVPRGGEQTLELRVKNLPKGAAVVLKSLRFLKRDAGRIQ